MACSNAASSYAVHPAVAHGQAMIANGLADSTGRSLPQRGWKLVAAQKLEERRAIMACG